METGIKGKKVILTLFILHRTDDIQSTITSLNIFYKKKLKSIDDTKSLTSYSNLIKPIDAAITSFSLSRDIWIYSDNEH